MALSNDDKFNLEVLKLVMHFAWADGELAQEEVHMLTGVGRSWAVPEPMLQKLVEGLRAGKRPGEPDWALLRTRPDDVIEAVQAVVLADGAVMVEESELMEKVRAALGA